jgi:hypothetical protein
MAIEGTFFLSDTVYSELIIVGLGSFQAFSGKGIYRNRGGCSAIPDAGPIPPGKYWIVDRPESGYGSKLQTLLRDVFNRAAYDTRFSHKDWFALYRNDGNVDDHTWVDGVKRGLFRLHPGQISEGCITLPIDSDYAAIRNAVLRSEAQPIPGGKGLLGYGTIEVISYGRGCL